MRNAPCLGVGGGVGVGTWHPLRDALGAAGLGRRLPDKTRPKALQKDDGCRMPVKKKKGA